MVVEPVTREELEDKKNIKVVPAGTTLKIGGAPYKLLQEARIHGATSLDAYKYECSLELKRERTDYPEYPIDKQNRPIV